MEPGQPLIEYDRGETTFFPEELLHDGDYYQIAGAVDRSTQQPVVIRAIVYDDEVTDRERQRRRASLRRQWELLELAASTAVTPAPVAWLELAQSPIDDPPEPVIVCERIAGPTLYDWIIDEHPTGLAPAQALAVVAQITDFLIVLHDAKWLWRDFDPRRFRLDTGSDVELEVRALSTANASKWKQPLDREQLASNHAYVAPEIRDEVSGSLQRPAADLYGLGALLSFLLTGEEPRHRVESPLSIDAYETIEGLGLEGLQLLVARLLQPLAKNRLSRASQLRPLCAVDSLPERSDPGFEMSMLPAPWLGVDIDDPKTNRGLRSKLSAGPLVSVTRQEPTAPGDNGPQDASAADQDASDRQLNWPAIVAMGALTILVVAWAWLF